MLINKVCGKLCFMQMGAMIAFSGSSMMLYLKLFLIRSDTFECGIGYINVREIFFIVINIAKMFLKKTNILLITAIIYSLKF